MIERFTLARDPEWYLAFPDLARTRAGRLICVYLRCRHHHDRSHAGVMVQHSDDDGRQWSPPRELLATRHWGQTQRWFWNCPRVVSLQDGRLVAICDQHPVDGDALSLPMPVLLSFSDDQGLTWQTPQPTPIDGIVPDRLLTLQHAAHRGRWVLAAHRRQRRQDQEAWVVRCWLSEDQGRSWSEPVVIACAPDLKLCEPTVFELPGGELVALLRENSGLGRDAYKCVSRDGGVTWSSPVPFPLPGCHRPVGGVLADGRVWVTYRFTQGGRGGVGHTYQNCFAALTDGESCLADQRKACHTRIAPLDYDRNSACDTGYTGWVQLPDQSLVIVNYILDDWPRGQIRGYRLRPDDLLLPPSLQPATT
jgi:sialidase-1